MIKEQEKNDKALCILDNKVTITTLTASILGTFTVPGIVASTLPTLSQYPHGNPRREILTQPHVKEKPLIIREVKKLSQGHTAGQEVAELDLKHRQSGSIARALN